MEEKKNDLFREKSLEKISSPEGLDKYIKTTSPSVILLFISVVILLTGLLVWAFVGKVEVKSTVGVNVVSSGEVTAYITEKDYETYIQKSTKEKITSSMYISFGNEKLYVTSYSTQGKVYDASSATTPYTNEEVACFSYSNIKERTIYYEIYAQLNTATVGAHKGKMVYSISSPIGYIF